MFYQSSSGIALDRNAKRQGAKRQPALPSRGYVVFEGRDGTTIESGFLVATENEEEFRTIESVRITDGTATAQVESIRKGRDANVPAGAISEIVQPRVGVDSVYNPEPTTGGRDRETDAELRARLDRTRRKEGRLVHRLLDIEGVRDVYLDYNDQNSEVDGLPPHCIAPIVWGGDEEEIAQTIMQYKSAGIRSYGEIEVEVPDTKEKTHTIGFSRPEAVPIYVRATVTGEVDYEAIRTRIISFIGETDEDGTEYDGLGINENLIYFQLVHQIGGSAGIINADIEWSTDGVNYHKNDIEIGRTQYATTDWQMVVVE